MVEDFQEQKKLNKELMKIVTSLDQKEVKYQKILQTFAEMEFKIFAFEKRYPEFGKIVSEAFKNAIIQDISPYTILAIVQVESNFNPKAISHAQAYGLMQVHYPTWNKKYELQSPEELFNIELNMKIGAEIFKKYLVLNKGDLAKALYMYNAGYIIGVENGYVQSVNRSKYNASNRPVTNLVSFIN